MRCKRIPLVAEVEKYEIGQNMEDGFELYTNVITREWIGATESIIQITREDGSVVCPYIEHKRGRIFIEENDYIIKESDGTKHVCGGDKIFERYEKI